MESSSDLGECPKCKSTSFELEQGNWICSQCGLVLQGKSHFAHATDQEGTTYSHNSYYDGHHGLPVSVTRQIVSRKRDSAVNRNALERTKRLGEYLKLGPTSMKNLNDTFLRLLKSKRFLKKFTKRKIILGGVVVFIVALQSDLVVPMEKICERIGCSLPEFKAVYNLVLEADVDLKPEPKPIESLIPYIINQAKFEEQEKKTLEGRTNVLVNLVSQTRGLDGKNPIYAINAALCLSWKSIKPQERKKVSFKSFCNRVSIHFSPTGLQRFKELVDHLSRLSQYLAWINEPPEVVQKNISTHIVDILNHRASIVHRYTKEREASEPEKPIQETSNLMQVYQPKDVCCNQEDPDISDSEIESYIRSEKEINLIKDLKEQVGSDEDDDDDN